MISTFSVKLVTIRSGARLITLPRRTPRRKGPPPLAILTYRLSTPPSIPVRLLALWCIFTVLRTATTVIIVVIVKTVERTFLSCVAVTITVAIAVSRVSGTLLLFYTCLSRNSFSKMKPTTAPSIRVIN